MIQALGPVKVRAIAFSSELSFEQLKAGLPWEHYEKLDGNCFQVTFSDQKFVLLFRYRAVVFVGFSEEDYRAVVFPLCATNFNLDGAFEEDEFQVELGAPELSIRFLSLSMPEWDPHLLNIICQVLARSCALSIVEREVDKIIVDSDTMTNSLQGKIRLWSGRGRVFAYLQDVLRVRHRLILQLALLKDPDIIWDNEVSDKVYRRLVENFDFGDRIEGVEKMLELSSDVGQFLLEAIHTRRSELLELVIIFLILIEVMHTFKMI